VGKTTGGQEGRKRSAQNYGYRQRNENKTLLARYTCHVFPPKKSGWENQPEV
jgi:hypothetical protein